jgi:hypothetical protein
MDTTKQVQAWVMALDRRAYAVLVGLTLGVLAGLVGLGLAVLGAVPTLAIVGALLVGFTMLTDLRLALYGVVGVMVMLPFGTLPFRLGLTLTLLDVALLLFLLVYAVSWMTGKRRGFVLAPPHAMIALYVAWLLFAFVLGFQYGFPNATILRDFVSMLLCISLSFLLVDVLREVDVLRQFVRVVFVLLGAQALLALLLFALPDTLTENLLVRLSRIGYPDGGVVRYIEDNPALGERAIGTWVDPNTLGGMLALGAAMIAPQLFAQRPLIKPRWLSYGVFGVVGLALFLTSSRASFLALAVGLFVIVLARYRRYLPLLGVAGVLLLLLPPMQRFLGRILEAFQGADISTQMRIGEWTDALSLISRYPFAGIGFTGTPFANLYTDVANMYLIMANKIGITGVVLFLVAMISVFLYGLRAWRVARDDEQLEAIHLGYHVALLVALVNAFADLYYFRLDFQASITAFWITVALCLASSRLVLAGVRGRGG